MDKYCFYLRHGLWNVVNGLLQVDELVDPQDKLVAEKLLWCAAADPNNTSFASQVIEFPWQQCWLASLLIKNLKLSGIDGGIAALTDIESLKRESEFQSILHGLPEISTSSHIPHELMQLYSLVVQAERVKQPVPHLSADAYKYIYDCLLLDPVIANVIIQRLLCVWCPHFSVTDNELQSIYTEALESCVQVLESRTNLTNAKKSEVSVGLNNQTTEHLCDLILCVLSIFEMSEEKENVFFERLCPRLLELCESRVLSRQHLFLAIVSRKRLKMARTLMELEDIKFERSTPVSETRILKKVPGRLVNADGCVNIEEMFLRLIKMDKHWIEDLVEMCGEQIIDGNIELVQKCLSGQLMRKLWPLVLLHIWKNYSDNEDIFSLLDFLLNHCKEVVTDPTFSSFCFVVEHHILVIKWCKKYGQKFSLNNRDFLEIARNYSTLEVLRRTTSLEDLEWDETRKLLLQSNQAGKNEESSVEGNVGWEVTTFDGFCIIRKVFDVLQASLEIENLSKRIYRYNSHSSNNDEMLKSVIGDTPAYFVENHPSVILRHPSLESEHECCNPHVIKTLYKDKIIKQLEEVRTMLSHLQPLNFRVEIIENIFSLLFLRYEDIQEETCSESGAEEYDGDQESKLHKSVLSLQTEQDTSFENLENKSNATSVTHNITNFQQADGISSLLRTMPVIAAHVSGSPPLETMVAEGEMCIGETSDVFVHNATTSSCSVDISRPSKQSPVEKFSSSFSGVKFASPSSHKDCSSSDDMNQRDEASEECLQCVSKSSTVTPEFQVSGKERKKSTRSNPSEFSAPSNITIRETHQGFVCNQYLIHNILQCLKDCLLEANSAIYNTLSKDSSFQRNAKIVSSVHPDSLQENMKRLLQYVNDAIWRLELLTGMDVSNDLCQVPQIEQMSLTDRTHFDWLYISEESESEDEDECASSIASSRTQKGIYKRSKSEAERSSESGSQSNKSAGGAFTSASSYQKTRRSKSQQMHNILISPPNGIVNMMLSSYNSLVVRCLINDDIEKAKEVVKMCGRESNHLLTEVKFIQDYHNLLTRLREIVKTTQNNESQEGIKRRESKKTSTLESIKKVASAGIQSTSLTNQVETFLSVTTIPGIQDVEKIIRAFPNETSALQGIDNNPAVTVLDLALTVGSSCEQSASLLDLACKKCGVMWNETSSSDSSSSRSRQRNTVVGYVNFGANLIKLLKESKKFQSYSGVLQNNISLTELVSSEYLPLSVKAMKDYISFWKCLNDTIIEFKAALEKAKVKEETGSSKYVQPYSNPKDKHKLKPHSIFRKFIEIFKGCAADGKISGNYLYYLHQLYSYLKLITDLIHQNLPTETGTVSEWKKPGTYFDLFNDSLVVLIGELVFGFNIAPNHLEPIAYKLKLNLVYSIVCNCCPKIPCLSLCNTVFYGSSNVKNWGQIVLNHCHNWNGPVRHPEVAVRSLLTDVLQIIKKESENFGDHKETVLGYFHISELAHNSNVKSILAETCELAAVDVTLLAPGDETLVFYTNLANLMWIHSLIALEMMSASDDCSISCKSTVDPLKPELNRNTNFGLLSLYSLERQISRKCVGYTVGNLGFVSLNEIYQQLLGGLNFPPTAVLKNYTVLGCIPSLKTTLIDSTSSDPRVLFSLMNDHKQSPKFQVLFPESVDAQLDENITDYLNHNVRLNYGSSLELVIPELLQLYQDYVLFNQEPESHVAVPTLTNLRLPNYFALEEDEDQISALYSKERISQLIDFLRDNTSDDLQMQINQFFDVSSTPQIDMSTVVMIEKSDVDYCIVLDYKAREDINTPINYATCEHVWKHTEVEEPVLKFLEDHCWLLSLLVHRLHEEKSFHASIAIDENFPSLITDERIKCLEQLFRSEWVNVLSTCFQNNSVVAALHSRPSKDELWFLLDGLVKKQEWFQCAEILWALPETDMLSDPKLQAFHDVVMYELASKLPNEGTFYPWEYCEQIVDADVQVQCLLQHLPQWPGHACQQALKTVLENHQNILSSEVRSQLKMLLHKISVYEKILPFMNSVELKNWYDIKCTSENNPSLIVELLLDAKEFQVCLTWLELHDVSQKPLYLFDSKFFLLLLESESLDFSAAMKDCINKKDESEKRLDMQDDSLHGIYINDASKEHERIYYYAKELKFSKLLISLPIQHSTSVCKEVVLQLRSLSCLKFLTNFLLNSCTSYLSPEEVEKYRTLSIGIQMIAVLTTLEQEQHWDLMWKPHLLVEQFVMNTRLEVLERMLSEVRPLLLNFPEESPVSLKGLDSMLRLYAGKALDFRVIQKSTVSQTFLMEERLFVSLSIASQHSQDFTLPAIVPSKNEWVPNEAVTECMCCQSVAFSMFNRRHHCRRCGRVICGTCSMKRTKVLGYGSVPVRVCDDCYQQMQLNEDHYLNETMDENLPPFSLNSDESNPDTLWKLTSDEVYNTTVREEFSFEYAPSVSLCLAILKLHSEHVAHPRFLLDACDRMLQFLQPVGPGTPNPEVDYSLVIRMVRSLAIAAKVRHAHAGHNSGVEQCDQLLGQVDLINMLVKNRCSALIPAESLNAHGLRRLRDCLVEEEHWTLALDVSMKAGLDSNIVWAAWGKALLRTGFWNEAWEKFTHCFNKGPDTSQPVQNPLLLNEIVQILEDGSHTIDHKLMESCEETKSKKNIPLSIQAQSVIQGLSSLKEISQGNYPQAPTSPNAVVLGPKMNYMSYNECCRYLLAYGSNSGIISFYLRHDDLNAALRHVVSKKVEPELFFEVIYIPCLREGLIADLHQALLSFDATLTTWESYLGYVCLQLERKNMFNVLYQLQLYMKDYVRAAITCTMFYQMGARNYTDLHLNMEYLRSAKDNLKECLCVIQKGHSSTGSRLEVIPHMAMKMNEKKLNHFIRLVGLQEEVNLYLYGCERQQLKVLEQLPGIVEHLQSHVSKQSLSTVPTLFGSIFDCMLIAVLVILCGNNFIEGFNISRRIIVHFNLQVLDVYSTAAKKFAHEKCHGDIKQLIECIKSSSDFPSSDSLCDEILVTCLKVIGNKKESGDVESLIKLIGSPEKRIEGYINCQLLKAAFLLAVKSKRTCDVEKILQEARRLDQTPVENLCLKLLKQKEEQ